MSKLEIYRVLALSTGHLRKETAEAMDKVICSRQTPDKKAVHIGTLIDPHPVDNVSFDCTEYGYLVWAGTEDEELAEFPEEIAAAVRLAKQHNCSYLKYDCDAAKIPELPLFDW